RETSVVYGCFGVETNTPVAEKVFLRAIGSLQIRGTSNMFRVRPSPIDSLKSHPVYGDIHHCQVHKSYCSRCLEKKYTVAMYCVSLSINGSIYSPAYVMNCADVYRASREVISRSEREFYSKYVGNELIEAIRSFYKDPDNSAWGTALSTRRNLGIW